MRRLQDLALTVVMASGCYRCGGCKRIFWKSRTRWPASGRRSSRCNPPPRTIIHPPSDRNSPPPRIIIHPPSDHHPPPLGP
eukprot:5479144-Pyramimonas_sp.AAC.1